MAQRTKWVAQDLECRTCATAFTQRRYGQVYCNPDCRPRRESWRNATEKPKASNTERGYGTDHRRRRAQVKPAVDRHEVECWRCGELITPDPALTGDGWDLGHDDHDRTKYRGPEHQACNRATKTHAASTTTHTTPPRHWIM